jgi:hypothetical protein
MSSVTPRPLARLARLIYGLVLRSYMQRLLEIRNTWLKSELERG